MPAGRMQSPTVTVETVTSRSQFTRFAELPYVLHAGATQWRRPLRTFDRWRLDTSNHPFFETGDGVCFLARRGGRPVGRISAHVARRGDSDGWFGFFDCAEDAEAAISLLDAATSWLDAAGATTMNGPVSWTATDEFGVLVDGFEQRALTGRPWHPPWYSALLRAAGLRETERRAMYRLTTDVAAPGPAPTSASGTPPAVAGRFADARLLVVNGAAVPDVADTLGRASLRSAWSVARAARNVAWTTAVVVQVDDDPAVVVPELRSAAGAAGYTALVAPWSPSRGDRPETVHAVFSRSI